MEVGNWEMEWSGLTSAATLLAVFRDFAAARLEFPSPEEAWRVLRLVFDTDALLFQTGSKSKIVKWADGQQAPPLHPERQVQEIYRRDFFQHLPAYSVKFRNLFQENSFLLKVSGGGGRRSARV